MIVIFWFRFQSKIFLSVWKWNRGFLTSLRRAITLDYVIRVPLSWRAHLARKTSSTSIFISSKVHLVCSKNNVLSRSRNAQVRSLDLIFFSPCRDTIQIHHVCWPITLHKPVFEQWLDDIFSFIFCSRLFSHCKSYRRLAHDHCSTFRAFSSKTRHLRDLNLACARDSIRFGAFRVINNLKIPAYGLII